MPSSFPKRLLAFFAPVLAIAVLFCGEARAGALQVRDDTHVLKADDVARLRAIVAAAPFDARLVFTNEFQDGQGLGRYVHSLVSEPDQVVVGVDPQHHHVQVHFGTGSRIPQSAWPAIEKAGNDGFSRGDWEAGAAAILRSASSAVEGSAIGVVAPAVPERTSFFGVGTVMVVILGVLGISLLAMLFRRRTAPYAGPGSPGYGSPYQGGGYGYGGAPPQGGMGPLGGGLIGAGLGGLAGYELGKLEGEREHGPVGGGGSAENQGGNFDAGGGGGDFDAGGGGSDWGDGGGGGGFDGGGGDSGGGGGSDF